MTVRYTQRIARYPNGSEWDLPITNDDDTPNEEIGWKYARSGLTEKDKENISRNLSLKESQMTCIDCHGCEFSWASINKARTYNPQKFILKKLPEFDVFCDTSYSKLNVNEFTTTLGEELGSRPNVSDANLKYFESDKKKNLVFFIRFTGRYKDRQASFFDNDGFL